MRNLEREIADRLPQGRASRSPRARRDRRASSTPSDARTSYLGPAQVLPRGRRADRASPASPPASPGRQVGGDILFIEATRMRGQGRARSLTGQLGDVMKESAQAALSYVRAARRAARHRPTTSSRRPTSTSTSRPARSPRTARRRASRCATALVSLLTGTPVRTDVAMTGEITLRGKVLPVGGIKEKVLAAHRARASRRVILPKRNEKRPRGHPGAGARGPRLPLRRRDGRGRSASPSAIPTLGRRGEPHPVAHTELPVSATH